MKSYAFKNPSENGGGPIGLNQLLHRPAAEMSKWQNSSPSTSTGFCQGNMAFFSICFSKYREKINFESSFSISPE
jgi:hypothetical protein